MKNIVIVFTILFLLSHLTGKSQTPPINGSNKTNTYSIHFSINAAGGEATGEGSVSYSNRKIFFSPYDGEDNYVAEGVQQPLIYFLGSIEEEEINSTVAAIPNLVADFFVIDTSISSSEPLTYNLMSMLGKSFGESPNENLGTKGYLNNTLAFTSKHLLLIPQTFQNWKLESFHFRVSYNNLKVRGGSGVIINAQFSGNGNIENDVAFTRELVRITIENFI